MNGNGFRDLCLAELQDIRSVERRLIETLPSA